MARWRQRHWRIGSLLKRDGKNLTCKVTIPEHGRPRVYVVSGALLEGDAD